MRDQIYNRLRDYSMAMVNFMKDSLLKGMEHPETLASQLEFERKFLDLTELIDKACPPPPKTRYAYVVIGAEVRIKGGTYANEVGYVKQINRKEDGMDTVHVKIEDTRVIETLFTNVVMTDDAIGQQKLAQEEVPDQLEELRKRMGSVHEYNSNTEGSRDSSTEEDGSGVEESLSPFS